jgi:hypothetical protein
VLSEALTSFNFFISFSILFLDSLKMHRKDKVARIIRKWLDFEWKRKHGIEDPKQKFFISRDMQLLTPKSEWNCFACLITSVLHPPSIFLTSLLYHHQFRTKRMVVIVECLYADMLTDYTSCGASCSLPKISMTTSRA